MVEQSQLQFAEKPQVDPETGELLESGPDVLSDEGLLSYITELKDTMSAIRTDLAHAEAEMIRRMQDRKATVYQGDAFQAKLESQRSYEYDIPKLLQLTKLVDKPTFEAAIKIEYKPNKVQLNKLCKFGGEVRDIIESASREVPKPPRLNIIKVA